MAYTLEELHTALSDHEERARDLYNSTIPGCFPEGYKATLDRHSSFYPENIKQVMADALGKCPEAAEMISFLLLERSTQAEWTTSMIDVVLER